VHDEIKTCTCPSKQFIDGSCRTGFVYEKGIKEWQSFSKVELNIGFIAFQMGEIVYYYIKLKSGCRFATTGFYLITF